MPEIDHVLPEVKPHKTKPYARIGAWACVAVVAAVVPFSEQLGQKALAENLPQVHSIQAIPDYLHLDVPETIQEGQSLDLKLGWRNLPAASKLEPSALTISWQDVSYAGQDLNTSHTIDMGTSLRSIPLHFESSGTHTLQVLGPDGKIWQKREIQVTPFPASVFPKDLSFQGQRAKDPERYHIFVNLFYDFKDPQKQRQYAQITYDDQIVDRFLVSSGAPGHDTPLGKFKVGNKEFYPRSSLYNDTPMPFWSAINVNGNQGEYGFHSLEGGAYLYLLGRPASHGCVRLSRKPSIETDPETGVTSWGDRGGARFIFDRVPSEAQITIFKRELPGFKFEDYGMYLNRQAREYREKQAQKRSSSNT